MKLLRKTARAAQQASLRLPGWAWEQGTHRLWILGVREGDTGYTLGGLEAAYQRVRSQVPRDDDRGNALRRYVRIHPTRAGKLLRVESFAMAADPNAMATSGPHQKTIQVALRLGGDSFRVQISHNFTQGDQNCFCFVRTGNRGLVRFIELPVL